MSMTDQVRLRSKSRAGMLARLALFATIALVGLCAWRACTFSPPPTLVYEFPADFRGRFVIEFRDDLKIDAGTREYVVRIPPLGRAAEPVELDRAGISARFSDGREVPVEVLLPASRRPDSTLAVWLMATTQGDDGPTRFAGFVGSYSDAVRDRGEWIREER